MLASTSGGALFPLVARVLFPFDDFYLVDDLFSVFLKTKRRRQQRCHRHHHAALVSNPIPRRSPPGRRPKFYNSWRRVTEKSTVSSSRRRRPALVLSLCLSLSLCGAFVLEMCACTNADWLFFSFLFNQCSDDGNVINDQQHRRCCCFLGEVVLQTKSSKCNDDE